MHILILAEHHDGSLEPSVHQLVGAARKLAGGGLVSALVLATPESATIEATRRIGVDRVFAVVGEAFAEYCPESFAKAACEAVRRLQPDVFLCAHSFQGMEIAPWVAAKLGLPLISNCHEPRVEDGALTAARKVYGAAWEVRVAVSLEKTAIASLARHGKTMAVRAEPAPLEELELDMTALGIRSRPAGVVATQAGDGDITRSAVVVGIGRGIRDPSNLAMIEDLAGALGGTVACSRPLVDLEWMPHSKQVGASGQEIAPKVYIACGISGAAQHLAGIRGAGTIVAINKDAKAPIFGLSDYGVVGDLFEIVPALTAEARKQSQS